jgi:hypothetical protein
VNRHSVYFPEMRQSRLKGLRTEDLSLSTLPPFDTLPERALIGPQTPVAAVSMISL